MTRHVVTVFVAGLLISAPPGPKDDERRPEERVPPASVDAFGDPLAPGAVARIGTLRFHLGGQATGLAFAPDGKSVFTAGGREGVCQWDAATGKELRRLHAPKGWAHHFALSPDGKAAAASAYGVADVTVRDATTGKEVQRLPGPEKGNGPLAFSRDGKTLAVAANDYVIRLWDVAAGRVTGELRGHTNLIDALCYASDGGVLVSAGDDRTVRWWDLATRQETRQRRVGGEWSHIALAVSADGKGLAWVENRRSLVLCDAASGQELCRTDLGAVVRSLAFSPDGRTVACAQLFGTVHFLDSRTGHEQRRWDGEDHVVLKLAFSPDGKMLAEAGDWLYLRDVAMCKPAVAENPLPEYVTALRFMSGGRELVAGFWDGQVGCWDPLTGRPRRPLAAPEGFTWKRRHVMPVALTPDGRTAALPDAKGVTHIWDATTGRSLRRIDQLSPHSGEGAFSADGSLLALLHQDETLRAWDPATGRLVRTFWVKGELLFPKQFSPDGRTLAVICNEFKDRGVLLLDVATGKQVQVLKCPDDTHVVALTFTPDGKRLVTAISDDSERTPGEPRDEPRLLRLWDVATGAEVRPFECEGRSPWSVAISPDGRTVAAGDRFGGRVFLWETTTGRKRGQFDGHYGMVAALAFSHDGQLLASGAGDSTALVWDLTGMMQDGRLPALRLKPGDAERLWADLVGDDAARAYRAVWSLAAAGPQAVPFLAERLRPARLDREALVRLIADLDADDFETREKAQQALEKLRELAEAALRKALAGALPAEARRRAEAVVQGLPRRGPSAEQVQTWRALEVLEHIGTPEARRLIESLAQGAPEAYLTQDAKATLARLRGTTGGAR
jgi:WD40 repeat protein